jgi:CRISPR/Cas system endoribonuclease Cas6 (RAMP superfamily)
MAESKVSLDVEDVEEVEEVDVLDANCEKSVELESEEMFITLSPI